MGGQHGACPDALNVVLLGPPGAGKGTQAERLSRTRTLPKISTGDILREAAYAGTETGLAAKVTMEAGDLVGDDIMISIVQNRLDQEDARTEQPDPAARQALTRFYAILDRLNAHDRTAFVLRFFEGLELTEIADALDISVSTTKRHLERVWKRVTLLVERSPGLATYLTQSVDNDGLAQVKV